MTTFSAWPACERTHRRSGKNISVFRRVPSSSSRSVTLNRWNPPMMVKFFRESSIVYEELQKLSSTIVTVQHVHDEANLILPPYVCTRCDKTFKSYAKLKFHLQDHDEGISGPCNLWVPHWKIRTEMGGIEGKWVLMEFGFFADVPNHPNVITKVVIWSMRRAWSAMNWLTIPAI